MHRRPKSQNQARKPRRFVSKATRPGILRAVARRASPHARTADAGGSHQRLAEPIPKRDQHVSHKPLTLWCFLFLLATCIPGSMRAIHHVCPRFADQSLQRSFKVRSSGSLFPSSLINPNPTPISACTGPSSRAWAPSQASWPSRQALGETARACIAAVGQGPWGRCGVHKRCGVAMCWLERVCVCLLSDQQNRGSPRGLDKGKA